MFERFTDRARRVLILAQEEARLHNSEWIGTEQILLGLIHEQGGIAAKTLDALGISLEAVREQVEKRIGPPEQSTTRSPRFTAQAVKALELALREALELGHDYIGTEHILLGVIGEDDGIAAKVLAGLVDDVSLVRSGVLKRIDDIVSSTTPTPPPSQVPREGAPPPRDRRPRRTEKIHQRISFSDVAGHQAAVAELREIKTHLLGGAMAEKSGGPGVLLYGPPGCGKTLLARALAAEARAAYISLHASDLMQVPAELKAARTKAAFTEAHSLPPAVLLIDELELIGPGGDRSWPYPDLEPILGQLAPAAGLVMIGETSRPDRLDPRLLRPGCFDLTIFVGSPDQQARLEILSLHVQNDVLDSEVDLAAIAERAIGFSGADLAHLVDLAALFAERRGRRAITQVELEFALRSLIAAPGNLRAS